MKLNCGCGVHKMVGGGWRNIDCEAAVEPDEVCALDREIWRFADDGEVDEVVFNHSLEHMGETVAGFKWVMTELYRVCSPDAEVRIVAPHPRHDDFFNDPTHVRPITPEVMGLLSRENCRMFREAFAANSLLAEQWGVDFRVEKVEQMLDPRFEHWRNDPGLTRLAVLNNNVFREIHMTLRVVKP